MMGNIQFLLLDAGTDFVKGLLSVLSLVMMIGDVALVVYTVYLFFLMFTASDEGKRKKAKSRMFNAVTSILIVLVLIIALSELKITITAKDGSLSESGSESTLSSNVLTTVSTSESMSLSLSSKDKKHYFKGDTSFSNSKLNDSSGKFKDMKIVSMYFSPPYGWYINNSLDQSIYDSNHQQNSSGFKFSVLKNYSESLKGTLVFKAKAISGNTATVPITFRIQYTDENGTTRFGTFEKDAQINLKGISAQNGEVAVSWVQA